VTDACLISIVDIPNYIQKYTWDDSQYPRSRSLIDIAQ